MHKIITARFYRTGSIGPEPVREWLRELSFEERQKIGHAIRVAELGWPIGMPVCRPLGEGLFEIRVRVDTRLARIFFCIADGEMWLLHGFMKTTQKTPPHELQLARQRKKELLEGR